MKFEHNETLEAARERNIRDALMEDMGRVDWTAQLIPAGQTVQAHVVAKETAVLCGRAWFDGCIHALDAAAMIQWNSREGDCVDAGTVICAVSATARALMSAERSSLNFLQMLSGVATRTRTYVDAIEGASRSEEHTSERVSSVV